MKKSLALSFLFIVNQLYAQEKTITIVGDEFCPHNCKADSIYQGYMVDIAQEALALYGYNVKYIVERSWEESITKSREGKYNAIVGSAKSDAPDFIFPNTAIGTFDNCFLARYNDAWSYNGITSLENKRVGIISSYTYGEPLNTYIKLNLNDNKKIYPVSGNAAIRYCMTKLKQGKIDIYVDDCKVIEHTIKSIGDPYEYKVAHKMPKIDDLYVTFNPVDPNSKEYAKKLDEGIQILKQNGRFDTILKKYGINEK